MYICNAMPGFPWILEILIHILMLLHSALLPTEPSPPNPIYGFLLLLAESYYVALAGLELTT